MSLNNTYNKEEYKMDLTNEQAERLVKAFERIAFSLEKITKYDALKLKGDLHLGGGITKY